eukprot:symbB.v1.2.038146.t1/scaffold5837.1/size23234/5
MRQVSVFAALKRLPSPLPKVENPAPETLQISEASIKNVSDLNDVEAGNDEAKHCAEV